MSSQRLKPLLHFLARSPLANHAHYNSFISACAKDNICQRPTVPLVPDQKYVKDFLDELEAVGPSVVTLCGGNKHHLPNHNFQSILPPLRGVIKRSSADVRKEPQQLAQCIRIVGVQSDGLVYCQELQHRLKIADTSSIISLRSMLTKLFKTVLNRRERLPKGSLEHDATLGLSRAIVVALARGNATEGEEGWKELDAMEQLLTARENKKEGLQQAAKHGFEVICRNQGVSSKTRLQALKVLCSSGEEEGDIALLESLVVVVQGAKECQDVLLSSIRKIKDRVRN